MAVSWLTPDGASLGLTEPVEMHASQSESYADDSLSAQVVLKVPWAQRHAVINNILLSPAEWPYSSGIKLWAANLGCVPFPGEAGRKIGAHSNFYEYDFAQLTVSFATLETTEGEEPGSIQIYSEEIRPTAEFITLPHDDFRWTSVGGTALKEGENPGRLEIGLEYGVTFYNLVAIPATILTLVGKSNSEPIFAPSLGLTFATETLLFNQPSISRSISLNAANYYTLKLAYSFRPNTWNKFWRPQTGQHEFMYHINGGGQPYKNHPPASFAGLVP